MEGKYIVLEGHDGAGKSTQVDRIRDYLAVNDIDSIVIEEPGSSDPTKGISVAKRIRDVIKDGDLEKDAHTNLLLFTAARHELWRQEIAPALKMGKWVLAARNWLSTVAYQGYGEGLDLKLIEDTTRKFTDERYMNPDATIILALEEEERAARILGRGALQDTPDTFESRDSSFQDRVQGAYISIAQNYNLPIVDAAQTKEKITEQLLQIIAKN